MLLSMEGARPPTCALNTVFINELVSSMATCVNLNICIVSCDLWGQLSLELWSVKGDASRFRPGDSIFFEFLPRNRLSYLLIYWDE